MAGRVARSPRESIRSLKRYVLVEASLSLKLLTQLLKLGANFFSDGVLVGGQGGDGWLLNIERSLRRTPIVEHRDLLDARDRAKLGARLLRIEFALHVLARVLRQWNPGETSLL